MGTFEEAIAAWKILKSRVMCSFCSGVFVDPRGLPCPHTFCLSCLEKAGEGLSDFMPCPECNMPFQIPESGFKGIMKNFRVNEFLEMYHEFQPLAIKLRLDDWAAQMDKDPVEILRKSSLNNN